MTRLLVSLLLPIVAIFAASSASAQTASPYGYQCFSTVDGTQYCSCQLFNDSDSGYEWLFRKLATLQQNADGPVMAGHSDIAVQTPVANCAN